MPQHCRAIKRIRSTNSWDNIIFPAAIASKVSTTFKKTFILGIVIAVTASLLGILIAHPLNIPASASIVVVYTLIFMFSFFIKKGGHVQ